MQMARWRTRTLVVAVTTALALALGAVAAAGTDDGAGTEAVLRAVEASPRKNVTSEMVARSRAALERAARLRSSGDEGHARLADGAARAWAEAARDVLRAVEVEEKAETSRRAATDAGAIADRERALLEEGIAQSGRLRGQLETIEKESKERPARTSAAANAETDGGVTKSRAPRGGASATAPFHDGGSR